MVWKSIKFVAELLGPAERQAVLGDIQERGTNPRALLDLLGLVALRQLQAWKSWQIWLLAATLLLPAFAIVNGAYAIADTASFYPWPGLTQFTRPDFALMIFNSAIATMVLGWTSGYTLAAIGRYRSPALLLPLATISIAILVIPLTQNWHHTRSVTLLAPAFALIAAVPVIVGMRRGWNPTPLRPATAIALALLCIPFSFLLPNSPYWSLSIINIAAFWPACYALVQPSFRKAAA